jgi:hypothetical protein
VHGRVVGTVVGGRIGHRPSAPLVQPVGARYEARSNTGLHGLHQLGRSGHPSRIDTVSMSARPPRRLVARLEVEDRPDRLAGDDPAGAERAAVADAVDFVADRLGVVAPTDEVGPQQCTTNSDRR